MAQKEVKSNSFYLFQGLAWGLIMFVFIVFIDPFFNDEPLELSIQRISLGLVSWVIMGLAFGYINKLLANRRKG